MTSSPHPYASLDPDTLLGAVDSVGYRSSGTLIALNSFENRVYQVGIEEKEPIVAKFYRPNRWSDAAILEEHAFALELAEHELPVVAPIAIEGKTLFNYHDFRFAIFPRKGGHALELDNLAQLEQMGRFIGRIHAVGRQHVFQHRITINTETYGHAPYQLLVKNNFIPAAIQANFCHIIEQALELTAQHFTATPATTIRLHGDFHAGNVLCRDQAFHIVDLDDCLMGPAVQDIWMMLSGSNSDVEQQLKHILDGYFEFNDFDLNELRLKESLRTLRMINYMGWLAKRWDDPTFPINFPWFNTGRYWETQLNDLREQVAILQDS